MDSKQFKTDFRAHVLGKAAIAAVIGSRFHNVVAPTRPGTPFGVYRIAGREDEGGISALTGRVVFNVEIMLAAPYADTADELADLFHSELNGNRPGVVGSTKIHKVMPEDESDGFDDDSETYVKTLTFRVIAEASP